jgi:hypothetical protein
MKTSKIRKNMNKEKKKKIEEQDGRGIAGNKREWGEGEQIEGA